MLEILQMREEQPWPKVILFARQHTALGKATPHQCPTILIRVNGHDTRRGIPPPEPLRLNGVCRGHEHADDDIPKGKSAQASLCLSAFREEIGSPANRGRETAYSTLNFTDCSTVPF